MYKQAEYYLSRRRQKIHLSRYQELKNMMAKGNEYYDKINYIDNQIQREIAYYENGNNVEAIGFQRIKNQLKKVEQQIEINVLNQQTSLQLLKRSGTLALARQKTLNKSPIKGTKSQDIKKGASFKGFGSSALFSKKS